MADALEIKEKSLNQAFAKEYISNGFNGKKAYLAVKPVTEGSAEVMAARQLSKVSQQKSIVELMEEKGFTDDFVTKKHKEVVEQDENMPARNTAIEMYHKLKGRLQAQTQHTHLHLHADINEIEGKLKAIDTELAELES